MGLLLILTYLDKLNTTKLVSMWEVVYCPLRSLRREAQNMTATYKVSENVVSHFAKL